MSTGVWSEAHSNFDFQPQMIFACSIKNLPRKINKAKHVLTVINLYFYSKLVALVSCLSTLKSQINRLSIIFFLMLITAGFCVCVPAGWVCFSILHLLLSRSFPLIFRELCAYNVYMMLAVQPVLMCSFFMSLQTYLLSTFSLHQTMLSTACYMLSKTTGGTLEASLTLFFYFF